ncbi:DUF3099 domain-containing protein [Propionicicella superfundia]|uniref:DUF3099 domain-containing protein n=1 Tax=Propionicicella superfundia TaxID=348582 RepID=UPI00040A699D|nr:DUF3099 domain-containing protein [Propionicicella superfundia]
MPGSSARRDRPTLITSARPGRSLDSAARNRRYLITMGVRVACFALAVAIDGWLQWVFLLGAAVLPAVAVLLANAVDLRRPSVSPTDAPGAQPQLVSPGTVPGSVEP